MGRLRSATRSVIAVATRQVGKYLSYSTKYALPRQIKPRILELSIRRRRSNSSIVLTLLGCEEIDCYCGDVVSAG